MTANVRVFIHTSLMSAPLSPGAGRFTTDAIMQLKQPYIARELLSPDTGTAANTSASITANLKGPSGLAYVQVQLGKRVHCEITPSNEDSVTEADTSSPIIEGDVLLQIGPNYRLSFLESTE